MSKENILVTFCPIISLFLMIAIIAGCVATIENNAAKHQTEFEDAFAIGLNPTRDYLVLVNDKHEYEFNGKYDEALQEDLIYVPNVYGEPKLIEKGTNLAFGLLKQHLRSEHDIEIELFDGYRTKADQEWTCEQSTDFGSDEPSPGIDAPGYSERHTGLLIHVKTKVHRVVEDEEKYIWVTEPAKAQSKDQTFQTIHNHLADFGFIIRYPAGKKAITGKAYRPYEIRFVGSSEVAHEIMDNELCLEEYLQENK